MKENISMNTSRQPESLTNGTRYRSINTTNHTTSLSGISYEYATHVTRNISQRRRNSQGKNNESPTSYEDKNSDEYR